MRNAARNLSIAAAVHMILSAAAGAQTTPAPDQLEEVKVTGSRVVRDGFQAPTPVTVIGVEAIRAEAQPNIADTLNHLPAFTGSQTSSTSASGPINQQGQNVLNLRRLGGNRTLILLDGRRVPITNADGTVDINVNIPQQLISRVDVVTGGASAAYGSDAVAGVVNFVLDKSFTGLKANVEGGVTTYGDDRTYKVGLTGGTPFAAGRGHLLLSGEYSHDPGIQGVPREWNDPSWGRVTNSGYVVTNGVGNGQPQFLVTNQVGLQIATPGGIVTSGPLRGTAFGPGGQPYQFNYGTPAGPFLMRGGEWETNNLNDVQQLWNEATRKSVFARASFDVTDSVNVYAQYGYHDSSTYLEETPIFSLGGTTIQPDNAFIPASIAPQVTAPLKIGSYFADLPTLVADNSNHENIFTLGAEGKFTAFDTPWTWDLYGSQGTNRSSTRQPELINANFAAAIDAVRNANGVIVCRNAATNPGCMPFNVMGIGVNSAAAVDYVMGVSMLDQKLTDRVFNSNLNGEPFSTWAGPVSVSFGVDYRKTTLEGTSSDLDMATAFFSGNFRPTNGGYHVTEEYLETVVPLASQASWADSLDFNGAVRFTDYSQAGSVTAWKAGLIYSRGDVRLRATQSRDIRAPSIAEMFTAGTTLFSTVNDPAHGNTPALPLTVTTGNPQLTPEKADNTGLGIVYQPKWLPGFTTSIDYYRITIDNAISSVTAQQILNRCATGATDFCSLVERDAAGAIQLIRVSPLNFVQQKTSGFDIEASYQMSMKDLVAAWAGDLSVRALATHISSFEQDDGVTPVVDAAGSLTTPSWRWNLALTYTLDPISVTLAGRGVSANTYDNSFIECLTDCPTSTTLHQTISNNHIGGAAWLDANITYKPKLESGNYELFFAVQNAFNRDPPVNPGTLFEGRGSVSNLYDLLGRTFRAGVRVEF